MDDGASLERILAAAIGDRGQAYERCPHCRRLLRVVVAAESPGDATSPVVVRGFCPRCATEPGVVGP
ncbi:hypothetical protein [Streptomyces sp. UNOC14_S4]|uniref:hypothetical protein n=1 Tax=Streptomyces sp. UNOC14_S4 TaxID=2872340 RepID=UPI001E3797B2|nr:hypothetical protein [Streptomyces sp. UNOC14_S4]MCC3770802.1 hypothetical protein [Streptomyces sp. UNOC14_S4]